MTCVKRIRHAITIHAISTDADVLVALRLWFCVVVASVGVVVAVASSVGAVVLALHVCSVSAQLSSKLGTPAGVVNE